MYWDAMRIWAGVGGGGTGFGLETEGIGGRDAPSPVVPDDDEVEEVEEEDEEEEGRRLGDTEEELEEEKEVRGEGDTEEELEEGRRVELEEEEEEVSERGSGEVEAFSKSLPPILASISLTPRPTCSASKFSRLPFAVTRMSLSPFSSLSCLPLPSIDDVSAVSETARTVDCSN